MTKKAPPEVLSPSDLAYMSTLNERDRRWFLTTKADDLKAQGFPQDGSRTEECAFPASRVVNRLKTSISRLEMPRRMAMRTG